VGATSWRYYTPYLAIAEAALQALRANVFARGQYVQPAESIDELLLPTVRRLGQNPGSPAQRRQIEKELQVHRAIETGDMNGLSPAIRNFATQIRGLRQAAGKKGLKVGRESLKRPASIKQLLERWREWHSLDPGHRARQPKTRARRRLRAFCRFRAASVWD
jgi:hypothetical protein